MLGPNFLDFFLCVLHFAIFFCNCPKVHFGVYFFNCILILFQNQLQCARDLLIGLIIAEINTNRASVELAASLLNSQLQFASLVHKLAFLLSELLGFLV